MFPPESSAQTEPVPPTLPVRSAATPTAPAPSTTSFERSSRSAIASLISSSVDHDELVEQLLEDPHRHLARVLDRDAVGDRVRAALGVHADEANLRPQRAHRDRDPRREPAAADRDQERLELGQLLRELEADRALAGDHALVLERVDERGARSPRPGAAPRRARRRTSRRAARPRRRSAASARPSPSARPAASRSSPARRARARRTRPPGRGCPRSPRSRPPRARPA